MLFLSAWFPYSCHRGCVRAGQVNADSEEVETDGHASENIQENSICTGKENDRKLVLVK